MRRALALALILAACTQRAPIAKSTVVGDPFAGENGDETPILRRELESEILDSYQRDDRVAETDWVGVLSSDLGIVRFGVGPDDEQVTTRGAPPPRRLPLGLAVSAGVAPCDRVLRSKKLELHMAEDGGTAWVSDEVAACAVVCGKIALVPLRLSAVYVRGADRWVVAVEHLSYAQPAAALIARGEQRATPLDAVTAARSWGPALTALAATAIEASAPEVRAKVFATTPDALVWWPDPAHELRGAAVASGPSLTDAFDAEKVVVERARIGLGPSLSGAPGTIAWWAGTIAITARGTAGAVPIRLRATLVFERRADRWQVVHAHVSAPIDDAALAHEIGGDGARVDHGLVVDCPK
ncbi:MAG: nuclear transport factor 2 family protein [Deltaproteobacteria bacterium]|nr:nuclear transport factor 2 family protein [Deltaproteobacteria bacterium]